MNCRQALDEIFALLRDEDVAVFSTGIISREAFSLRDRSANFYMLGSMGMAVSFSLGIALARPRQKVVVIDGDGAAFMNLGGLAMAGFSRARNIVHIVFDNGVYASTGGQRCISSDLDLSAFARSSGYARVKTAKNPSSLHAFLRSVMFTPGPQFLRVMINAAPEKLPGRVNIPASKITGRLQNMLKKRWA
jgi:thiamine pyrophosphate-dependent acetolactate synthase large subunit-like protein